MPKRRLGVALLFEAVVAAELDGLRRALGDGSLGRIPPHLTLVPPVNVRDDRMAESLAVLREAASATEPFVLAIGPAASFLPVNPVVYLSVGGQVDALLGLRERVFRPPLERILTYPFVPHVTLADETSPERIAAALTALAGYRLDCRFDEVHLLEEGESRVWRPVASARFSRPAVVGRGGLPLELSVTTDLDPEAAGVATREWHRFDAESGFPASSPFAVTARREGEVVGVATGEVRGEEAYLGRLIVAAGERGQGIGSHLLAAVESLVAEQGCGRVSVRAPAGGRTEGFYRARGWVEVTRLPRWRAGRDFMVLERLLG